jgi:hypothetical protein
MLYVKAVNGSVEAYPYTLETLRWDNPNVSFPASMTEEELEEWGVYTVQETVKPEENITEAISEGAPILEETGKWIQSWVITPVTAEEVYAAIANKWAKIRSERDVKLNQSDWVVTRAFETNTAVPVAYTEYRQALRDITNQEDPFNVVWPNLPSD